MSLKPFLPNERSAERTTRALSICRGIVGMARNVDGYSDSHREVARAWPGDRLAAEIATRAAVPIESTATATALLPTAVSDLAGLLGPVSGAFAGLVPRVPINITSTGPQAATLIPSITPTKTGVSWLGEGAAMQVKDLSVDSITLEKPFKLAFAVTMTRESFEHTNADALVRAAIVENGNLAIDGYLLDSEAASSTRPAGILAGISPTAAASGGGVAALAQDVANLASAVGAVSGGEIVFITSLATSVKMSVLAPALRVPVLVTTALDDDVVVAIAVRALAIESGDQPIRLQLSRESVLHMEDTAPTQLSGDATATPVAMAFPIRSLFQTDCVAVRLIADLNWKLRASGAVATVASVTW